ncbi:hypothetical protein, partial [uncultured Paraglaciecola sp.]|uniref:hypothetical protein n=1 Tax=uncultured Paraglaciecola sp. TaxID=1765024 RepID=UPI002631B670
MSIQSYWKNKPSMNSASVRCRVGRNTHSWLNQTNGANYSATDTALSKTVNGVIGFECPTAPNSGDRIQEFTIGDINNDPIDIVNGFGDAVREFSIAGLDAGESHIATIDASDFGANVEYTIQVELKALPSGTVKSAAGSCHSTVWSSETWGAENTAIALARHVQSLGCDYFGWIDDLVYQAFGGVSESFGALPYYAPKSTNESVPLDRQTTGTILEGSNKRFRDATVNSLASDAENLHVAAAFRNMARHPAFSHIARLMPIYAMIGDHDAMMGNDFDFRLLSRFNNLTDLVTAWKNCTRIWDVYFGRFNNPDTYAASPATPDYPSELGSDPVADYGAEAHDFTPSYFKIDTDHYTEFVPNFLAHRDPIDGGDTATLLGTTQKTELKSEVDTAAASKKYIIIRSAKQFYAGVTNNPDGYASVGKNERDELVAHFKTKSVSFALQCGDSHTHFHSKDANIFEMNIAPFGRTATGNMTTSEREALLDGTEATVAAYSGDLVSIEDDGIYSEQGSAHLNANNGFGFIEATDRRLIMADIDRNGSLIGGVSILHPFTATIGKSKPLLLDKPEVNMGIHELYFTAAVAGNYIGGGITPEGYTGDLRKLFLEKNSSDRFAAAIIGIADKSGKQGGFSLILQQNATEGGHLITATGFGSQNFPPMSVTISEEDGSNPVVYNDPQNVIYQAFIAGNGATGDDVDLITLRYRFTGTLTDTYGFVAGERYKAVFDIASSGSGGGGSTGITGLIGTGSLIDTGKLI